MVVATRNSAFSMPHLHLVRLRNDSILQQLRLEEALLRADRRNWCILNSGSEPAVVLGVSGKVELLLDCERMAQEPLPVIRRFSGGGTVVVDANTLFATFIIERSQLAHVDGYPDAIMRWSEGIYAPILPSGVFQRRENDYAIGDRKFGGNAQYLCRDRWLHHTSLLWDYDPRLMDYLLLPSRQPVYRAGRSHEDFVCTLKPYFPHPENFFDRFRQQLSQHFVVEEADLSEVLAVMHRPHRKGTSVLETQLATYIARASPALCI